MGQLLEEYKRNLLLEIANKTIKARVEDDMGVTMAEVDHLVDRLLPLVLTTNFSIRVSKTVALSLINMNDERVMCKEYGQDEDWVGLVTDDLCEGTGELYDDYKTFEIWCLTDEETIATYESIIGDFDTEDFEYLKQLHNDNEEELNKGIRQIEPTTTIVSFYNMCLELVFKVPRIGDREVIIYREDDDDPDSPYIDDYRGEDMWNGPHEEDKMLEIITNYIEN